MTTRKPPNRRAANPGDRIPLDLLAAWRALVARSGLRSVDLTVALYRLGLANEDELVRTARQGEEEKSTGG